MNQKRVLAVHDISCVGRCSLTTALPIISSAGIECSVLPTAVLSTHTGGFTGFTYRDLTEDMLPIDEHWVSLGRRFDAVYTGFLGSFEQIDIVKKLIDDLTDEGSTVYVDPVMGDAGKLYSVFGEDFPKGMRSLCEKADVIIPNLTELNFMLGKPYVEGPYTKEYIDSVIEDAKVFGVEKIIITGVSFKEGEIGAVYYDYKTQEYGQVMRPLIEGYYHGTGDVFGSALVGAMESGLGLAESVSVAVNFTVGSIVRTHEAGEDVRYGVNFEEGLKDYSMQIDGLKDGVMFEFVTSETGCARVAVLADRIWHKAYPGILTEDLIDHMVSRFQTTSAIVDSLGDGFVYAIIKAGEKDIGYFAYRSEEDRLYLSKLYIDWPFHGLGISSKVFSYLKDTAANLGKDRIQLNCNRANQVRKVYEHEGFRIVGDIDIDVGDGYEIHDHVMELRL